jgi:hypothetical protein
MKPIMAKDLRDKIDQFDPRIDEFIAKECESSFMQGNNSIRVAAGTLSRYKIETQYFIKQLQLRGFIATYQCEDRPCGVCWVEIILPPGDE